MPDDTSTSQAAGDVPAAQRLRVRHLTRYDYDGDVTERFNDVRLCPVSDPLQRCEAYELRIEPSVPVHSYHDFYLNRVDHFDISVPHRHLEVEVNSIVETRPDARGEVPAGIGPEGLEDPKIDVNFFDFQMESLYVTRDVAVWREAVDVIGGPVTDLWADAVKLGRHVFRTFTYLPASTDVSTRVTDVLQAREGVCQDFAHVMLALCRTQDIPARYVSGYFFSPTRPESENEATHAWVEIYIPGYGWKGFDPTHDRVPDTHYIKLAVGRDYHDIKPISGRFRGRMTEERMHVEVSIRAA